MISRPKAANAAESAERPPRRPIRRRLLSPLTRRILAVNILPLVIVAVGLLYLGQYKRNLIESELGILQAQGRLLAQAIGQGAVEKGGIDTADGGQDLRLVRETASQLVHRLAEPSGARVRLFGLDGTLIADSRRLLGPGGIIEIETLPEPTNYGPVLEAIIGAYNWIVRGLPSFGKYEPYHESATQQADDYEEVRSALSGETASAVRVRRGHLLLTVAEPVQHYKRVMGALLLSTKGTEIEKAMRSVRLNILSAFAVALAATVLLSVYLAGTIARPIHRLAAAAERVRRGHGRSFQIPDLTARKDEIGDLSGTLRDMTAALWLRMDAIERFAADVAHEIKNPLTSLRSAVETAARVQDPEQQRRLMTIIFDDVRRLDRLISDISDASRLDAELSRAETGPVDIGRMLEMLVDIRRTACEIAGSEAAAGARLQMEQPDRQGLQVPGIESRLVQVFRNLISNAESFSPPDGRIVIRIRREDSAIAVVIEDEGPGIPDGKEEAIFERFYTERPEGEKFGTHSGLGLSISRQIVEAHGGTITAQNRRGSAGQVLGARFIVRLPVMQGE